MLYEQAKFAVAIAFTALILTLGTGCKQTPEEARQTWNDNIDKMESALEGTEGKADSLVESIENLQSTLDGFGDNILPDQIAKTQELLDAGKEALLEIESKRDALEKGIVNARIELASIPENASSGEINARMYGKAVSGVGAVLPPPYNAIALGLGAVISGAGGLFGLFGTRKAKQQAAITEDLVVSVEETKRKVPALAMAMHEASAELRSNTKLYETKIAVEAIRTKHGKATTPTVA